MGFAGGATTTLIERSSFVKDFWSDVEAQISLTDGVTNPVLGSIDVADLPTGITLTRVVLLLKVRAIENTSDAGANAVLSDQVIQVKRSGEEWGDAITAINMVEDMWTVAASTREVGDVVIGDNDIKATVDGNGTYNVRWASAQVDRANLQVNDIQVGFRMFWEVE